MTTAEFSSELDTIYENINKNGAPGLDGYEKSVILTHAQEALVKGLVQQDPTAESVSELISVKTSTAPTTIGYNGGYVFDGPTEYIKILNEKVKTVSGSIYTVLPISNEQYQVKQSKAYKYPPRRRAWRLGLGDTPKVELFLRPNEVAEEYTVRYVAKPTPIIIEDLAAVTPPETIDGISDVTGCKLNTALHRDILKYAATLAEQYYYDKYGKEEK